MAVDWLRRRWGRFSLIRQLSCEKLVERKQTRRHLARLSAGDIFAEFFLVNLDKFIERLVRDAHAGTMQPFLAPL